MQGLAEAGVQQASVRQAGQVIGPRHQRHRLLVALALGDVVDRHHGAHDGAVLGQHPPGAGEVGPQVAVTTDQRELLVDQDLAGEGALEGQLLELELPAVGVARPQLAGPRLGHLPSVGAAGELGVRRRVEQRHLAACVAGDQPDLDVGHDRFDEGGVAMQVALEAPPTVDVLDLQDEGVGPPVAVGHDHAAEQAPHGRAVGPHQRSLDRNPGSSGPFGDGEELLCQVGHAVLRRGDVDAAQGLALGDRAPEEVRQLRVDDEEPSALVLAQVDDGHADRAVGEDRLHHAGQLVAFARADGDVGGEPVSIDDGEARRARCSEQGCCGQRRATRIHQRPSGGDRRNDRKRRKHDTPTGRKREWSHTLQPARPSGAATWPGVAISIYVTSVRMRWSSRAGPPAAWGVRAGIPAGDRSRRR